MTPQKLLNDYYSNLGNGTRSLIGIPTQFNELNKIISGLDGLEVLGGVEKAGKTTLALQIAYDICKSGIPILYIAMEESRKYLYSKILSRLSSITIDKILLSGKLILSEPIDIETKKFTPDERDRLLNAQNEFNHIIGKFYLYTTDFKITIDKLEQRVNYIKKEHNVDKCFVVIDHLQNFPSKDYNDLKDKIDTLLPAFKKIYERTSSPFLIISQKNRAYKEQTTTESLMGSAGIEYTADVVLFLNETDKENMKELVVYRNRYGESMMKIKMEFTGQYFKFKEVGRAEKYIIEKLKKQHYKVGDKR